MYDAKIIKLLTEMKMNCLGGTAYDDPLRGDKAEALNYAIFAVNAVSGDYRWHDLQKDPNDLPKHIDQVIVCVKGSSRNWVDAMFYDHERKLFTVNSCTVYEKSRYIGDNVNDVIAWREIEPFEVTE